MTPIAQHLRMFLSVAVLFYLHIVWCMPRIHVTLCITIFLKYPEVFVIFYNKGNFGIINIEDAKIHIITRSHILALHRAIYQAGVCRSLNITV